MSIFYFTFFNYKKADNGLNAELTGLPLLRIDYTFNRHAKGIIKAISYFCLIWREKLTRVFMNLKQRQQYRVKNTATKIITQAEERTLEK